MGIVVATIGDVQIQEAGSVTGIGVKVWNDRATPHREFVKRPRSQGSVDTSKWYESRTFSLDGVIVSDDPAELEELCDQLTGAVQLAEDGTPVLLQFQRDGKQLEQAYVTHAAEFKIPRDVSLGTRLVNWSVDLVAADPRVYAAAETTGSYDPTTAGQGGGITFPLVFPLTLANTEPSGIVVENIGNAPTPPIYTITGPVVDPIIDNDATGKSIYTQNVDLAVGETLLIDVGAKQVLLGGTTSRPDLIDSKNTRWADLARGAQRVSMRGSKMQAGSTELAVTFRSARI